MCNNKDNEKKLTRKELVKVFFCCIVVLDVYWNVVIYFIFMFVLSVPFSVLEFNPFMVAKVYEVLMWSINVVFHLITEEAILDFTELSYNNNIINHYKPIPTPNMVVGNIVLPDVTLKMHPNEMNLNISEIHDNMVVYTSPDGSYANLQKHSSNQLIL